jgi:hypothetical protein
MLIGYVSDESYVALTDVAVEFVRDGQTVAVVRSTPRGAIDADIAPGEYEVVLVKAGFGSKRVTMRADPGAPYQFRLLSDRLLGYVWPKWSRADRSAGVHQYLERLQRRCRSRPARPGHTSGRAWTSSWMTRRLSSIGSSRGS